MKALNAIFYLYNQIFLRKINLLRMKYFNIVLFSVVWLAVIENRWFKFLFFVDFIHTILPSALMFMILLFGKCHGLSWIIKIIHMDYKQLASLMIWIEWQTRPTQTLRKEFLGTSLAVQWLRLRTSNAGGVGLSPGRGTRLPRGAWPKKKKKKKKDFPV